LSADNNRVSTSKHYQLSPKHKLLQTNSLVTTMAFHVFSAIVLNSKKQKTKVCILYKDT